MLKEGKAKGCSDGGAKALCKGIGVGPGLLLLLLLTGEGVVAGSIDGCVVEGSSAGALVGEDWGVDVTEGLGDGTFTPCEWHEFSLSSKAVKE